MNFRRPRVHNEKHLAFIRSLECICCGDNTSTEAAHVRFACLRVDKRPVGNSEKPDDCWTIPLCGVCHRSQHQMNEVIFWDGYGIDPIMTCLALWRVSGDHAAGSRIISSVRRVSILAAG